MLKRIFLGLVAVFFIFVGIFILSAGYFFAKPEKFLSVFHAVTEKVFEGQKYDEQEEFFLEGIEQVDLTAHGMGLIIETYSGSTLKVLVHGKVPRFESGPFILQSIEGNSLLVNFRDALASSWIQLNVNGEEFRQKSDVQLTAQIFVPETFKGHLNVRTNEGLVTLRLPENLLYELDLQSVSGKITNNLVQKTTSEFSPQDVGHIKIQTGTGSILVGPKLNK